ncbi:MAG: hypothetical protein JWP69_663 [Flaviaesturariibacter sp.]|nr:hypothetical protein [Flaviaesturariibacter sp.]
MLRHRVLCLAISVCISVAASAQLGKIPVAVTVAFAKQYVAAQQVSYKDNLSEYSVQFMLDSNKMIAYYNSKGVWKGSEKDIAFEELSTEVKDGLAKSKYADWKVSGATVLYLSEKAGGGEQYRVKVVKGDIQKKYLYFNRMGRLVRDAITL